VNVRRWVGPAFLVLGLALVVAAVATGAAQLELVVFLPVFVGGASALFLGGIALVFVGLLLLPFTFGMEFELVAHDAPATSEPTASKSGGVILVGPIPFFFGAWKSPSKVSWWIAAGIGAAMVVAVLVLATQLR
jgi:uncharacterized membrane protein